MRARDTRYAVSCVLVCGRFCTRDDRRSRRAFRAHKHRRAHVKVHLLEGPALHCALTSPNGTTQFFHFFHFFSPWEENRRNIYKKHNNAGRIDWWKIEKESVCVCVTVMSIAEVLPLEVIDKTINQQVWIILQSNREFTGTLVGFDDFVNVIIEDATEWTINENNENELIMEHHGRLLLSGNNINMLVPGGKKDL